MQLDDMLYTLTVEDVLVGILRDPNERQKISRLMTGEILTVSYDYGQFQLTAEQAKDMLLLLRLRGKLESV